MHSLERWCDRYPIKYVYKIIIGMIPKFQDERFKIRTRHNARRGLLCKIPSTDSGATAGVKLNVDQ